MSALAPDGSASSEVIWHDVECGAYSADLALWSEIGREAAGPLLELGAGTGRVALALAAEGLDVTTVDSSAELVAELRRRAVGTSVRAHLGDARELRLERRFAAVIAPMQLVHLLAGAAGRGAALASCAAHLQPGGVLAAALLDLALAPGPAVGVDEAPPLPDVREIGGWVYSSLPIEVLAVPGGIEIRRLRQVVAPDGELSEELSTIRLDELSPETFEAEARSAGLAPRERIVVPPTADHVGSVVCVLEAGR